VLCIGLATVFRLNRITTYLAAHIGNPLSAPLIIYLEIQTGHWVRTDAPYPRGLSAFEGQAGWDVVRAFSADLFVGVPLVAGLTALVSAFIAYALCTRRSTGTPFDALVEHTAARYLPVTVFGWEWVRAKLRIDPVYKSLLADGLVHGRVADLGCGRGHLLVLLDEARVRNGGEAAWTTLYGIERRSPIAEQARAALGQPNRIVAGDIVKMDLPEADSYLLLDVLHYLPAESQESLLARVAARLPPGGVLLVRDADRSRRAGFLAVVVAERICAWARGHWKSRHHYRASAEWTLLMEKAGLTTETRPMGSGTPFANTLIIGQREC
jgi:SAM-dependent methyltransferase